MHADRIPNVYYLPPGWRPGLPGLLLDGFARGLVGQKECVLWERLLNGAVGQGQVDEQRACQTHQEYHNTYLA